MVKLISVTQGADSLVNKSAQDLIAFTARVSSPKNQENFDTAPKLIKYLIKNRHWSPLEMVHLCLEIKTSRAIAAQILRHKSFSFQEFSQRYSEAQQFQIYEARRQDLKNRQNSIDDLPEETVQWFDDAQNDVILLANKLYSEALQKGIAKESARFLLPLNTETTLYMCGSARSWVHYIDLRCDKSTQLEHREIAEECKKIFCEQFPDIASAMDWAKEAI